VSESFHEQSSKTLLLTLTARQKRILEILAGHEDGKGYLPTFPEIGKALGIGSSTTQREIAWLKKIGLVQSGTSPGQRSLSRSLRVTALARHLMSLGEWSEPSQEKSGWNGKITAYKDCLVVPYDKLMTHTSRNGTEYLMIDVHPNILDMIPDDTGTLFD
jgi:LexA DNA binding domain